MIRPNQKPSNEEIIGYGTGEAQVRLEFAIGERKYRVVREVHRTRASRAMLYELGPGDNSRPIATGFTGVTSEVENLLGGITYNEIVASSVVAQKDLERLIRQRLDDRRKVVNVFLNLDSFNTVQDLLNQDKALIEGTNRNPGKLTLQRQQLETLRERVKEYHEKEAQLSELKERVRKLTTELGHLEKESEETDALYKTLKDYDEAVKHQESLQRELSDKTLLKDNLAQQLASITSRQPELEQARKRLKEFEGLDQVEPELAKISSSINELRELELRRAQRVEQENQLSRDLAQKAREVERPAPPVEAEVHPSRMVWGYLAATGALGAGAVLSFFLSLIVPAVALASVAVVFLILLARQIAALSQEAQASEKKQEELATAKLVQLRQIDLYSLRHDIKELTETISKSTGEVLQLLKGLPRYSASSEGQDNPKAALEVASSLYAQDTRSKSVLEERVSQLEKQLEEEPSIRKNLRETEQAIQQVTEKLREIRLPGLPAGVVFSSEALADAGRNRDSLNEKVSRVRTQIEESADREKELRIFLEENKDLPEQVEAQERDVRLLEKELAVLKYAVKGLEQTSESLRNRVKPQVERYMGQILPAITSGRYKAVELDDDYTVRVFDPEAGEFKQKEVFSGGTEDQLLLAMRLAFALALIPQAKGQSPEFLFLDEPLGSSDQVRREGILALLRKELAQNFRQIFLISHVGDMEADADTIIQMDNGMVREVISRKPSLPEPLQVPA